MEEKNVIAYEIAPLLKKYLFCIYILPFIYYCIPNSF